MYNSPDAAIVDELIVPLLIKEAPVVPLTTEHISQSGSATQRCAGAGGHGRMPNGMLTKDLNY